MRTLPRLSLLTTLLAPLAAQGTIDLDKLSPGTLGATLQLQLHNAPPNRLFFVMISYQAGPTPIAAYDPADARSVDVGVELASNWYVLGTDGAGAAAIPTALPNDPGYQGQVLHWQCATFPGTGTIVDQLSNPVVTPVGMPGLPAALPNALLASRGAAVVCRLPNRNAGHGDFLLASGATTEIFQSRTLDSVPGPAPLTPRGLHAAATLTDGRVLFTGGVDGTGAVVNTCELYDPATNTFSPAANLLGPRAGHAAATLADGRVMVAGGTTNFTDLTTAATGSLNTVELYNPTTNTWTAGPVIGGRRLVPALTLLNTGRMMISGGIEVTVFFGIPIAVTSTNKVQLFNATTNAWSNGTAMPNGRAYHHDSQVTLADGRVLLSGGVLVPDLVNAANAASIAGADVYNPTTNTWTATTMAIARTAHSATRLADGRIVVAGGSTGLLSAPTAVADVEVFQPATNTWAAGAPLGAPRAGHTAALLPDGLLVLLGGAGLTSGECIHP